MADNLEKSNTLSPRPGNRSVARGDVPEALGRRYFTDDRGGAGVGFYIDATTQRAAFRDEGRRLVTDRADPNAICDMAIVAQHRGWTVVTARGSAEFRREAWLAGRTIGVEVRGYSPTERDVQELDRRLNTQERLRRRREDEPARGAPIERQQNAAQMDFGARSRLQIAEMVVRSRVEDQGTQDRLLGAARRRIADWLEQGARFEPLLRHDRAGQERMR